MGSAIASFAFLPPKVEDSRAMLDKNDKHHKLIPSLKRAGKHISILHFPANPAAKRARRPYVILFSHGNAEDLSHGYEYYKNLSTALSADVVCYDYPGYCWSDGPSPTEDTAYDAINTAFTYVTGHLGFKRDEVLLVGRSIGSGVTGDLAHRERGLAGLVLLSPLTSAAAVAGNGAKYGLYPFDIFCNIRKIDKVNDYPILIIHGAKDKVIDVKHGKALYAEASKTNAMVDGEWVDGADHNDVEHKMGMPRFVSRLKNFMDLCGSTTPQQCTKAKAAASSACSTSSCKDDAQ